jgi:hypothetical protein
MNRISRLALISVLCLTAGTAIAGKLKIKEHYDDFTKEMYLRSGNVSVCQPRSAGMVPCATLRFEWRTSASDMIIVHFETPGYTSVTGMAFNIDGNITSFDSLSPTTDLDYDASLAQFSTLSGQSSANVFVIPTSVLRAITDSEDNGIFRITGTDGYANYDFYRKSGFGSVPANKLGDFVSRVESEE